MKVYSRRRKLELLEKLEIILEQGDILLLDDMKCVVAKDKVTDKKYVVVNEIDIFPYDEFFKSYKDAEFLTELFTDVSVISRDGKMSKFFEKFFNRKEVRLCD